MGYAVLHLEKAKGTDSGMSAHIERTIAPRNADNQRTHLNREMISFHDGVASRTEAIQHRLDNAGLARKIGTNQVRAIRVLLTGSPNEMKKIKSEGRLDEWCVDNLEWLRKTYGAENVVSVVLHLDEKTPHIHATVVPIVTTERKRRKREENATKTYRRKKPAPRLCADEVMSRTALKGYQDSYAAAMEKYGLERGIDGSKAKHISTAQFYRELQQQSESLQVDVAELLRQQEVAQKQLAATKAEVSREKLKNSAAEVGSKLLDSASSLIGTSKVKRLEAENATLKSSVVDLKSLHLQELEQLKTKYQLQINELTVKEKQLHLEKSKLESLLQRIFKMFPVVREVLRIEKLCKAIGFASDHIRRLFKREKLTLSGTLINPTTNQKHYVENLNVHIQNDNTDKTKLHLLLNQQPHTEWFREQQQRMHPRQSNIRTSTGKKI